MNCLKALTFLILAVANLSCNQGSTLEPSPNRVTGVPTTAATSPNGLRISIAVPVGGIIDKTGDDPNLPWPKHEPHLHVVIENVASQPQSIFDEWNSEGFSTLTFECSTPDGKHWTTEKYGGQWGRNYTTCTVLLPGQMFVRDVWLDDRVWKDLPNAYAGPVTMKAIFAQNDPRYRFGNRWFGTAESTPAIINFHPWHQ